MGSVKRKGANWNQTGTKRVPEVSQRATKCINKSIRFQEHVLGELSLRKGAILAPLGRFMVPFCLRLDFEDLVFLYVFGAAEKLFKRVFCNHYIVKIGKLQAQHPK